MSTPEHDAPSATATALTVVEAPKDTNGINRLIIVALVYTLGFMILTETAIMILSWFRPAADGPGVNSVHEVIKGAINFILGNLSAVVQAKLVGQNHER